MIRSYRFVYYLHIGFVQALTSPRNHNEIYRLFGMVSRKGGNISSVDNREGPAKSLNHRRIRMRVEISHKYHEPARTLPGLLPDYFS